MQLVCLFFFLRTLLALAFASVNFLTYFLSEQIAVRFCASYFTTATFCGWAIIAFSTYMFDDNGDTQYSQNAWYTQYQNTLTRTVPVHVFCLSIPAFTDVPPRPWHRLC